MEEEQRVGLGVHRDAGDLLRQIAGHAVAAEHQHLRHRRGGHLVDVVPHAAEDVLAGRQRLQGAPLVAEPAALVLVGGGLGVDVDRCAGQVRAGDDRLAAGERAP